MVDILCCHRLDHSRTKGETGNIREETGNKEGNWEKKKGNWEKKKGNWDRMRGEVRIATLYQNYYWILCYQLGYYWVLNYQSVYYSDLPFIYRNFTIGYLGSYQSVYF